MAKDEAKASKNDKGEDYEFIPEDFDEDAFIHKELVSFRTTSILFVWGILAALVSYAVFYAVDGAKVGWLLGLAIAAAFGLALRWLFPKLKADIKHFKRREWLGTGFLFFFAWLAFFLIAINPPISDFAPPRVDLHAAPPVQQAGGDVEVLAFFEDNAHVASYTLAVTGPHGPVQVADVDLGKGHHRILASALPAGVYEVQGTATDGHGLTTTENITFAVQDKVFDVEIPGDGRLDSGSDQVFVQLDAVDACTKKLIRKGAVCIRTVFLDVDGSDARVPLQYDAPKDAWIASPNFVGWPTGNVTFHVVAEFVDGYAGSFPVEGGSLTGGPFHLDVSTSAGDYVVKVLPNPGAPTRRVPDLGLPLLAVALVAVVAIARRR